MLLGFDEYPYHQVTASFAGVAGSDPQWNDGHYVCLCDQAGDVSLASTLRLYSNNDVLDGFVCIRNRGKQHNIRVSRRLRPDMDSLSVGPLRIELVEPMRVLRLVLEDNDFNIALNVTCRSATVPYAGPAEVTRVDGRLISERMTYELTGNCEGWVRVGDARYELSGSNSSFFRNHSWGYPQAAAGPASTLPPPWGLSVACPVYASGSCSTCPTTAGSISSIPAAAPHPEKARSCSPTGAYP